MTTVVEEFNELFINNFFGVITGTFAWNQFPDVPGNLFRLKARSGNAGSFFIQNFSGTAYMQGFEMDASEDTGWIPISNLNQLWHGGSSGSADLLAYWGQR